VIQIRGADKMESSIRLFVPNSTDDEKRESQTLLDKLSGILQGFTVTDGKGVYKMKSLNKLISEETLVVDISITQDDGVTRSIVSILKEYGINAHEETIMFNINGVSYISKPSELEVG
jgi:hypothetical protein